MSNDDEIQRLTWIEEALMQNQSVLIQQIINLPNIGNIKTLEELHT
jgi:hypothetical protein